MLPFLTSSQLSTIAATRPMMSVIDSSSLFDADESAYAMSPLPIFSSIDCAIACASLSPVVASAFLTSSTSISIKSAMIALRLILGIMK